MPKTKETHNETQSHNKVQSEGSEEASSSDNKFGRILRKRKVNLNRLASSISCPQVCQFQHCGIQLADSDTLEVSFNIYGIVHLVISGRVSRSL